MRVARRGVRNVATRGTGFNLGKIAGKIAINEQENLKPVRSAKLLITNLDNNVTDSDICELFSEFGSIREVAVHYNCWGYSLGTAHVVFVEHEHAAEAARRYNGVPFDGHPMTITIEGSPNGSYASAAPLPVKMRLSFGPNHVTNTLRNPLSQVNRPSKLFKTPKRLGNNGGFSGPGVARGRGRQRGVPAVRGRGRPVGRLPTAAELDLELDEYHQNKKITNGVTSINEDQEMSDDFGLVKEVLEETPEGEVKIVAETKTPKNTPGRGVKRKKTPSRTPATKTPSRTPTTKTPGTSVKTPATKTPSRTPAKTPSKTSGTPAGTSVKTPATKTPSRTPATKTPSRIPTTTTPARTPKTKTPSRTPTTKTPSRTPTTTTPSITPTTTTPSRTPTPPRTPTTKTPTRTPKTKTPSRTPKTKTPSRTPKAKTPSRTQAAKPLVKTSKKTPAKTLARAARQTEAPVISETPALINDLEEQQQQRPASAVRGSVKKSNPRRSGRFSRFDD